MIYRNVVESFKLLLIVSQYYFTKYIIQYTAGTQGPHDSTHTPKTLRCEISIIGGGVAGTYTAMQLAKKHGNSVCLFEKEIKLGGRLMDIKTRPNSNDSPRISIGGRRVLTSHKAMMNLKKELNIKLQKPHKAEQHCFARGQYNFATKAYEKDEFAKFYFGLPVNQNRTPVLYEDQLIDMLFTSTERKNIDSHPNQKSYIRSVIGDTGFQFLHDMKRFKADFTYSLSAKGYIDRLEEEYTYAYDHRYPIGGMSKFVRKMARKATFYGARIFKSEPIDSINKDMLTYNLSSRKRNIAQIELLSLFLRWISKQFEVVLLIQPGPSHHLNSLKVSG